jgi:hypothetical protein
MITIRAHRVLFYRCNHQQHGVSCFRHFLSSWMLVLLFLDLTRLLLPVGLCICTNLGIRILLIFNELFVHLNL